MTMESSPSLSSLISGIINDAQTLIREEMTLARREIQDEIGKTKMAAVSLGSGVAILALGGVLLSFMLVYLVHEVGGLPLWASFGIFGGLCVVAGGALLYVGKTRASSIHLVPPQTVASLKENVRWLQNQT
jgi:hypothetical protein